MRKNIIKCKLVFKGEPFIIYCHSEHWNKNRLLTPDTIRTYFSGLKNKIREIDSDFHVFLTNSKSTEIIKRAFSMYTKKHDEKVKYLLIVNYEII